MRLHIRKFVALVESILNLPEPIYEFGALQVRHQKGFANLRTLFPGKSYVGCDIHEGLGVDRIEDVISLTLPRESVGTVIFVETIEHVQRPQKALEEIYRVLK
jgi:SAM-dependent methyltransferase